MLLLVIIGGVITGSILFVRYGTWGPAPKPTEGQVTDLNWSIFTDEGLAYIDRSREVRIDFSDAPVAAEPLGLPEEGELTIGPKSSGDVELDYGLIVSGGGEGPGGAKFIVTQLTITTADGVIESVRAPLREVVNFRETLAALQERAEVFGWHVDTDIIFEQVEQATKAGEPYTIQFGPGDRVGVPISATASCDPSGYCLVEYEVTPAVR